MTTSKHTNKAWEPIDLKEEEKIYGEVARGIGKHNMCYQYHRIVPKLLTALRKWENVPRCPGCGTSVVPKVKWMPYVGPSCICKCIACHHEGALCYTDEGALKAFYGKAE